MICTLFHLFNKYVSDTCYMPGTILGAENTALGEGHKYTQTKPSVFIELTT